MGIKPEKSENWDKKPVPDERLKEIIPPDQWELVIKRRIAYQNSIDGNAVGRDGSKHVTGGLGRAMDHSKAHDALAEALEESVDELERGGDQCWQAAPPAPLFRITIRGGLRLWMCGHDPAHPAAA